MVTRSHLLVIRAFCVWTVFVWVVRLKNILGDDRSVGFKVVHCVIAAISVAFAVAVFVITRNAAKRPSSG